MSFPMSPSHPVTTSTSISQKLAARNAAHRFKYGSPKIRDQLREVNMILLGKPFLY